MKYNRFEDLPVWNAAIEFGRLVYELTNSQDFRGHGSLKDQLERAAVSVSNNIAEGFERGTTTELIYFLYIARGSAGECRSMLCLLERIRQFSNLKSQIELLKAKGENISRQLHGWVESLKNSEIKGTKFLNEKERQRIQKKKDFLEFKEKLEKARRGEPVNWDE